MTECVHNPRSRYTHGFMCRDCGEFFGVDTPIYRSGELLSSIWMVLNNINVERKRNGESEDVDVRAMKEEIGIGEKHDNYEFLIEKAEKIMADHNVNADSATVFLKGK